MAAASGSNDESVAPIRGSYGEVPADYCSQVVTVSASEESVEYSEKVMRNVRHIQGDYVQVDNGVYVSLENKVHLYWTEETDSQGRVGWWIGPEVNGELVNAFCESTSQYPPLFGWHVPFDAEEPLAGLTVVPTIWHYSRLANALNTQVESLQARIAEATALPPTPPPPPLRAQETPTTPYPPWKGSVAQALPQRDKPDKYLAPRAKGIAQPKTPPASEESYDTVEQAPKRPRGTKHRAGVKVQASRIVDAFFNKNYEELRVSMSDWVSSGAGSSHDREHDSGSTKGKGYKGKYKGSNEGKGYRAHSSYHGWQKGNKKEW